MQNNIKEILKRLRKNNPTPSIELTYNSDFELLIAVVLSAQATDISVNKATKVLFAKQNTPISIYKLGEEKLKKYIQSIGLYNTKAKNIIALCKIILEEHKGIIPNTREKLEKLPGVGRKTANIMLNTIFNQPAIAVDTHVFRVANVLGITKGKTPLEVEKQLLGIVPKEYINNLSLWLVLHGRYICKARKPECTKCFLTEYCGFYLKQEKGSAKADPKAL